MEAEGTGVVAPAGTSEVTCMRAHEVGGLGAARASPGGSTGPAAAPGRTTEVSGATISGHG